MASTYSTNLKIELMGTGENSGTWGTITNTNLGTAFEQAVIGLGNPDYTSDANLTITLTNSNASQAARCLVLNVTSAFGSLTATRELIVPTIQKQYIVQNNTTGGQSITVKTSAGTGITVPTGRKAHLYVDGTNVIQMFDFVDINGGTIDGTAIGAASASTGAFTSLTASGATTLNGAVALGDASGDLITVPGTVNSNLLFTDATYDIGASGATRPRDMFLSRNLTVGGTLTLAGGVNLNGNVTVGDSSADTLTINSTITSNLIFTDNTYDIGASGATRPRNLFLAGNATIGGAQTLTGALTVDSTTDSTSTTTGSIQTDGGVGIAKALFVGTTATISGTSAGASVTQLTLRNNDDTASTASRLALQPTTTTGRGGYIEAINSGASGQPSSMVFAVNSAAATATERMRLTTTGLGIGVTAPDTKLQVGDTSDVSIAMSNSSSVTSGNRGSLSMFNSSNSTVGLIRFGAVTDNVGTEIQFYTRQPASSLAQTMTLDSFGNLGIGVTTVNYKLDVDKGSNGFVARFKGGTRSGYIYADSDAVYLTSDTSAATAFGLNETSDFLNFYTGNAERMRVTSVGKVCIGTTEANRILNVYESESTAVSSSTFYNASYAGLYLRNTSNTTDTVCGIGFSGGVSGNSCSGIGSILESVNLGALGFFTGGAGVSSTAPERMRITSAGNVGIGTNSPSKKLSITGTGNNETTGSIQTTNTNAGTGTQVGLWASNGTQAAQFSLAGTGYTGYGAYAAGNVAIYNDQAITLMADNGSTGIIKFATGGNTERMRIRTDGKMLINSTTLLDYSTISYNGTLQIAQSGNAQIACAGFASGSDYGGEIILSKSNSNTIGTNAIVQNNDKLGTIFFAGANGTGYSFAAHIRCLVDGTPGASADMPGALVFATSSDGSATPTERVRITAAGDFVAGVQVKSTNSTSSQKYVIEKVYDLFKASGPTTLVICDITSGYASGGMYVEITVTGQFNDFDGLQGSYLSAMVTASDASATTLIRQDGLIIGAINFSSVSTGVVRVTLTSIRSSVFNGIAYVRVICGNASSGSNVDPSGVTIS